MKTSLIVATAVAAMLAPVRASTLTFDFSFTNDPSFGTAPGTVTGEIVGLSDNATSAATALYIDSFPTAPFSVFGSGPFSLQLPGGTPFDVLSTPNDQILYNTFTVSNGQITSAHFAAKIFAPQGWLNNYLELDSTANLSSSVYTRFTYDRPDINGVDVNRSVGSLAISFAPVSPVPIQNIGTGLPGVVIAIGFFTWWRRCRRAERILELKRH